MTYSTNPGVAIIGAGPYGLSVAAHLGFHGVDYRIFGNPMQSWRENMPKGMFLKSEGDASNLFSPGDSFTLKDYCAAQGLLYAGLGKPVSLETFTQYGLAFQHRFVPRVENTSVVSLRHSSSKFELELRTGEVVAVDKVVVATGISNAAYLPDELKHLPSDLLTHSGQHHDLNEFKDCDVTVIGGGQSALETSALLQEQGARVTLIVRKPALVWNPEPQVKQRTIFERIRRPRSKLGLGLGPWLYSNAPMLFRYLPRNIRIPRVRKALGPAGAWWLIKRVVDRVPVLLGHSISAAEISGQAILLKLRSADGELREIRTSHVIAGTGYRFNVRKLPFMTKSLLLRIQTVADTPLLSSSFESSVPGLYFTGLASANQFGPVMRFLDGASFTAQRVSDHVVRRLRRYQVPLSGVQRPTAKWEDA